MNKAHIIPEIHKYMRSNDLDACIIPSTDPHMGEYIPSHWSAREWVSGFNGSAGTVVITMNFAGLWTDSRYFIQAEEQLKNSEIKLVKLKIPHTPEHIDWLSANLAEGSKVAIDGQVISLSMFRLMESAFKPVGINLVSNIDIPGKVWNDRPELPKNPVFEHDVVFAGESRKEKISRVRKELVNNKADYILVCTLDEVAWLLNLRGKDVSFNPVFVCYAMISARHAILFIDPEKVPSLLKIEMQNDGVSFMDYRDVQLVVSTLEENAGIMLDPGKTNYQLYQSLPSNSRIIEGLGIVARMKAIKNDIEIKGLRKVMIRDGVAWVKFLYWLDKNLGKIKITELSAARKLEAFRGEQANFQGPSFYPISSFAEHGAVVHYSVNERTDIELEPNNIYLCDTGGQYLDGTTDTTRTISLGEVTAGQKRDFTLALRGTIGVSILRFPKGTRGYQMDILARKALWDHGLNYGHGTGHGVGFFLNVHEGPQTIGTGASGHMNTQMEPGMVTTVEPAIYRDGQYGMRTENVTLVVEDMENEFGRFYKFETLTLAPIDINLIDTELLSPEEKSWLNAYHQEVMTKLGPGLDDEEIKWLKAKTQAI